MVMIQNKNPDRMTALNDTRETVRLPVAKATQLKRTFNARLAAKPMTNVMMRNPVTLTTLHIILDD